MPVFYQDELPGVLWNPNTGSEGVRFVAGKFETEDVELSQLLADNGYRFEGDLPQAQEPDADEATDADEAPAPVAKPARRKK